MFRSAQATHPGSASIDRHEAAQREILAVEQEKSAEAVEQEWAAAPRELSPSDDEWEHMPTSKKWYMEAKVGMFCTAACAHLTAWQPCAHEWASQLSRNAAGPALLLARHRRGAFVRTGLGCLFPPLLVNLPLAALDTQPPTATEWGCQ